MKILWNCKPKL